MNCSSQHDVMHADVQFVFDRYCILITVPYDGTYNDAVQLAKEVLIQDGVMHLDTVHEINVEDSETLRMVED